MKKLLQILAVTMLAGLAQVASASLLHDDSILFEVNLTTTSGNLINTSGNIVPGTDAFCFFTATVGCPPGTLWDTRALNGAIPGWDLGVWFEVQEAAIAMFIFDTIFSAGETASGTVTYSDIGWGNVEGEITGGVTCGFSTIDVGAATQCDSVLGATPVFSANAVTLTIDAYPLIQVGNSVFGGQAVGFVIEHAVPAPATLALFGLGLAGLGWSRRKKA